MGFIEETGAAQTLRDARIGAIYEGTNGIQAIDLVTRKLPMANGAVVGEYINELKAIAEKARAQNRPDFGRMGERLATALDELQATTDHLLALLGSGRTAEALAGATPYLRLFGLASGGAYLAKAALASLADSTTASTARIANAAVLRRAALAGDKRRSRSRSSKARRPCSAPRSLRRERLLG